MRLASFFMPTLKEDPSEAQIVSHRLMLRAGMIRQVSAGIYSWLPLGFRVLKKIEQITREEMDRAGAQELLMPTLQPADLWRESGRYDDYGKEMLRIRDRHDRDMVYGPTNEELITDIFRHSIKSYRDLPKNLYHIQWKFRDEVRPRFGIMRGREFFMKDAYSFDLDFADALCAYFNMYLAYTRTFGRMGLSAIPVKAESGAIGGDLSHEFLILAETGESHLYYDHQITELDAESIPADADAETITQFLGRYYAAVDNKHADWSDTGVAEAHRREHTGIEVGHIFYFGTKYSVPMGATVTGPDGAEVPVHMGSYGVGVSRLVGAIIEASHDADGIVWPESVAPFKVGLINLKPGDDACDAAAGELYDGLRRAGIDVLYDDTEGRAGAKFATMDLIGLPWQVTIGPKGMRGGTVELKERRSGRKEEVSPASALSRLTAG